METKPGLLKCYPLVAYFVLACAISWVSWLPLAASSHNLIPIQLPAVVFYNLAAFGPVLAAIIVSGAEGEKPAVRALLGKVLKWRVGVRWYLAALLGYPALFLIGSGLDVLLGGNPSWPHPDLANLHMPYWFLVIIPPFVLGGIAGCMGGAGSEPIIRSEGFIAVLSKFTPHAHAIEGYYRLMAENGTFMDVLPQMGILLAMGIVFFLIAVWRFRFE